MNFVILFENEEDRINTEDFTIITLWLMDVSFL